MDSSTSALKMFGKACNVYVPFRQYLVTKNMVKINIYFDFLIYVK